MCMQVLRDANEDPAETAAAVASANAALEEDEWPGLRPPRKRQKTIPPGQPKVRGVPCLSRTLKELILPFLWLSILCQRLLLCRTGLD